MKTWRMIEELSKNPFAKFRNGLGSIVTTSKITNKIVWENAGIEDDFVVYNHARNASNIDIEWEQVQKPVSFMEAVKAYSEGKTVTNIRCTYEPTLIDGRSVSAFSDKNHLAPTAQEILESKWFIEP